MATPKKTTTRRAPRATASKAAANKPASNKATGSREADAGIAARTGRTIKRQPYTSAAIATGAVTAVAAAVAGIVMLRRSDKSLGEISSEVTSRVKDGLSDAGTRARDKVSRLRDGLDDKFAKEKSQSEIAEEALTLKETGPTTSFPIDPVIEDQSKVGSIGY